MILKQAPTKRRPPATHLPVLLLTTSLLAAAPAVAQTGDVVIDGSGIHLKLITTRPTSIYAQPDKSSRSAPAQLFQYWYVLPPDPSNPERRLEKLERLTHDGFYRVAASIQNTTEQGWLAEEDAIVWIHRQAVRPAGRHNGQPVKFYPSRSEALAALETGNTSAATHSEPIWSDSTRILMPILEAEEVSVNGDSTLLYKVAFVSGAPSTNGKRPPRSANGTPPHSTVGLTQSQALTRSTLDLVFVIDTTASMANPIDQVRQSVAQVAGNLANQPQLGTRLRFGLVAYRDTVDGRDPRDLEYVAKVFCTLNEGANHGRFLSRLAQLAVTKYPSADYPEDVFAGLHRAMDAGMGWNPYAWKQIVVVGDSSAKTPDHPKEESQINEGNRTLRSMLEQAHLGGGEGAPFVVSVVRVRDPSFEHDHVVGDRQFNRLVAGEGYNGYVISAQGGAEPEDFSKELTDRLKKGIDSFKAVIDRGGVSSPAPAEYSSAEYPYPLLDLIRTLPDEASSDEPLFATRYSTEIDPEGNRVLVPHVLVRQGQLRMFVSFVDFLLAALEEAGEPGSRDVETVVSQLQSLTLSLNLDEPLEADTPIVRVLSILLELPVKGELFQLSPAQLAVMDAAQWQSFVRSVDASRTALRRLLDNSSVWFKLHSNSQDRHAFVPISDLP